MNNQHTSKKDGEVLLRIIDEHWIKYVVPTFIYVAMSMGGVLLMILSASLPNGGNLFADTSFIIGVLLLCFAHHWFFAFLLGEAVDCIVITNQRAIFFETKILLHDDMVENSLDKMRSVEVRQQGILQNVLLYGTVHFEGGTDIHLVPHPHRITKEIEQAMGRI